MPDSEDSTPSLCWQTKDPLDRLIGSLPGPVKTVAVRGFLVLLTVYGIGLATMSLHRIEFLQRLRWPFMALHQVTNTQQGWAMFHSIPRQVDFQLIVHAGYLEPGVGFMTQHQLGPVLPDFEPVVVDDSLRHYLYFNEMLIRDVNVKKRNLYFRKLSQALLKRYADEEAKPTHFVVELNVELIAALDEVRKTRKISESSRVLSETHLIGKW